MPTIKKINARQILDSRGNPTLEVDVSLDNNLMGRAAVPSGASTGKKEALELRDGDESVYLGKGVKKAIDNIHTKIAPALVGKDPLKQREIDQLMIDMDGTPNKGNLGANALLGVSMAVCRAGADVVGENLFRYLHSNINVPNPLKRMVLPAPLMNIINGGAHASNNLDIQEFMIVPHINDTFSENLRAGVEVFHHLKKVLASNGHSTNVGDEGGFAPSLNSHEEALDSIMKAIELSGRRPGEDISISLDSASSEFFKDGQYHMQGKPLSSSEMIEYYQNLCHKYPIYSIEDGLDEDDHEGWREMTQKLGSSTVLVGDDLFVTNKEIFQTGIEQGEGNAILIKVNQIGTLSETFDTLALAYQNDYKTIISHRSGETADTLIADLAVACGAGHIKTGSASRSDRIEKYNQLLRIEELLGEDARFNLIK